MKTAQTFGRFLLRMAAILLIVVSISMMVHS